MGASFENVEMDSLDIEHANVQITDPNALKNARSDSA